MSSVSLFLGSLLIIAQLCSLEPFLSCNLERKQKPLCAQLTTASLPLAAEVMILKLLLAVSFCVIWADLRKPYGEKKKPKNQRNRSDDLMLILLLKEKD